jgi:transmembrane 9 superfamily protein 2/4
MRGVTWFLLIFFDSISGFYVPGVAPIDFEKEEKIEIKAVKMTSSKTQLPYEYYSLPMCKPETVSTLHY